MRKLIRSKCLVDDCPTIDFRNGLCIKHFRRWQEWGDPLMIQPGWEMTLIERFESRCVDMPNGCRHWTGFLNHGNYGRFTTSHTTAVQAHRWSYEHFVGPIPAGWTIDHLCHTSDPTCPGGPACLHRRCVLPSHLEAVTMGVNVLRGNTITARNAAKTHCPKGHPYDFVNSRGQRGCRTCRRESEMRYNARKRAEQA